LPTGADEKEDEIAFVLNLRAKDHSDVERISVVLPLGPLWRSEPNAINNAKFYGRSHDSVI